MSEPRNPFPQPNRIRRYVRAELLRRKVNTESSQVAIPTPTIMPFVRFTSTKSDPQFKYRLFHLGLHGYPGKVADPANPGSFNDTKDDIPREFGSIFELGYGSQDVVGYGINTTNGARIPILSTQSQLTKGRNPVEGRHPVPGITNISVEHLGANEPIRTTVNWVCYNSTQLEFLRQHFLMAGGYVVVEFGHIMSNRPDVAIPFQFSDPDKAIRNLTRFVIEGRQFMSDRLLNKSQGNYNMVIGRVVDQSISFEADGTIHCSTIFYSTGEAVFGLHNNRLLGRPKSDESKEKFTTTIGEFFANNGRFDNMLQDPERVPFVIDMRGKTQNEIWTRLFGGSDKPSDDESVREKFKSNDARFIPWDMFIQDVLTELFSVTSAKQVAADALLFTTINKEDQPAVGNHFFLSSTDPEAMVIVKPFMLELSNKELEGKSNDEVADLKRQVDSQQVFGKARRRGNIFFVSGSETNKDEKGLLTNGIWLNAGAIKEAFHSQNTFYESIKQLLQHMNNATENYWELDLAFDEETKQYKIYDKKCVFKDKDVPTPYVFNRGNQGELLNLSFDADFSKEAKTAILLASRPITQKEIDGGATDEGAFNQPSLYTTALNIPILHDDLGLSVHNTRLAAADALLTPGKRAMNRQRVREQEAADIEAEDKANTQERSARESRLERFAQPLGAYIALPSELIARIFNDGLKNPNQINNFVAPIPTEINLSMTMQGITGMAFYDTFLVDKLPEIYAEHGVFLINDIKHEVNNTDGWTTEIGGLYYFVHPQQTKPVSKEPVGPTEQLTRLSGNTLSGEEDRLLQEDAAGRKTAAIRSVSLSGIR